MEIDRQQGENGAELDQHREGLAEFRVVETEKMLDQQQVPGRGNRQVFRQSFDEAEEDSFDQVEQHKTAPRLVDSLRGEAGGPARALFARTAGAGQGAMRSA